VSCLNIAWRWKSVTGCMNSIVQQGVQICHQVLLVFRRVQNLNGHLEDQEPKFVCDVHTHHNWSTGIASPTMYTKVTVICVLVRSTNVL
jgi:hypothetical protein